MRLATVNKRLAKKVAYEPKKKVGSVYFVQAGLDGPIKIGYAKVVENRLEALQCANHEELRLISSFEADVAMESAIHRHFESARIRGEWFTPTEDLLFFIRQVVRMVETPGDHHQERAFDILNGEWLDGKFQPLSVVQARFFQTRLGKALKILEKNKDGFV